jgi:hypothetical protein
MFNDTPSAAPISTAKSAALRGWYVRDLDGRRMLRILHKP